MPHDPNPYDFVPLESSAPARRVWSPAADGIERLHPERYSGRLTCSLKPESPLFIHGEGQQGDHNRHVPAPDLRGFSQIDGGPGIYASALKGALRSIFEIVSNSCLSSLSDIYEVAPGHFKTYRPPLPQAQFDREHATFQPGDRTPAAYRPCTHALDGAGACPACLLFGMVEHLDRDGRARKPQPLGGRLACTDAQPKTPLPPEIVEVPGAGGGPHPWHTTFYFGNGGRGTILGRKLYFHHRDYGETKQAYVNGRTRFIKLAAQRSLFKFELDFTNLREDELAYLVYALHLEANLRQHLGYGKAYGLGSALIQVERLEFWHRPPAADQAATEAPATRLSRFTQLAAPAGQAEATAAWAERGKELWLARPGGAQSYAAFAQILAWPGAARYRYPDLAFFRDSKTSGQTLAQYQRAATVTGPAVAPGRARGTIVFYGETTGLGRINCKSHSLMLRLTEAQWRGSRPPRQGETVEFMIGPQNSDPPEALDVRPVEGGA